MKIGILTQPLLHNYGGIVQNYALQSVLRENGHNVCTIDWAWNDTKGWRHCLITLKNQLFFNRGCTLTSAERVQVYGKFEEFIDKYIDRTPKIFSPQDFSTINIDEFDAFIVGSDQCWRPKYNGRFLSSMYLSFLKNINTRRIAYAVSFGTDEWEYSERESKDCSELAKLFDVISVREKSGVYLCRNYLGVNAHHVLDPTLLLDCEHYKNLIEKEKTPISDGTLYSYILDPTLHKLDIVKELTKKTGYKVFSILPQYRGNKLKHSLLRTNVKECSYPSITNWLRGFMDAKMTIVDSFHGVVFSIIFNKPFWVIGNKLRGNSRFLSILEMLDLKDRLIEEEGDNIREIDVNQEIDWETVNEKLMTYRKDSIDILLSHINE